MRPTGLSGVVGALGILAAGWGWDGDERLRCGMQGVGRCRMQRQSLGCRRRTRDGAGVGGGGMQARMEDVG